MTEQELFSVPVPAATKSYAPVPHKDIVETAQEVLDKYSASLAGRTYRTNEKGTQVIGLLDLAKKTQDFGYRLTFQNSYDKSMAVGFTASVQVLVCSNGMMIDVVTHGFRRKHTGSVREELKVYIHDCLKDLGPLMRRATEDAEKMRQVELDRTASAELAGRLFIEQEIVTATQLSIIKRELEEPTYDAFQEPNLWSFYNYVTHALKRAHPTEYVERHRKLHDFIGATYL